MAKEQTKNCDKKPESSSRKRLREMKKDIPDKTPKKKIKKIKRFSLKKFKLEVSLRGHKAGSIIELKCARGTSIPEERYWRQRLKDAAVDKCMARYRKSKKQDKTDNNDTRD